MTANIPAFLKNVDRRGFIGGSDVRIVMGDDEAALLRLWREKRGEVDPELDFVNFTRRSIARR
jgi:predicted phage-related endonuclease